MRRVLVTLLLATSLCSLTTETIAQTEQIERIKASYILAFGRNATGDMNSGEVKYWLGQGNLSIAQLLDRHRQYIAANRQVFTDVIIKSYLHTLGYMPSGTVVLEGSEIEYHLKYPRTYAEMRSSHMAYVNGNSEAYKQVVIRSYKEVFKKEPTKDELNYWMGQPKYSYDILVSLHQQYLAANQKSKLNAGNITTAKLAYTPVSLNVAIEARNAVGIVAAGGGNIVAAGAGNIVAAGAGNIVAAGAGNIVGNAGGN